MKTRFFVFPDEATASMVAHQAGLTAPDETGEYRLVRFTEQYAIDVIGTVYVPVDPAAPPDEDGAIETVALPGWHVNARILTGDPLPETFAAFEVFPKSPMQDFL